MSPSFRLRMLRFTMRWIAKPVMKHGGTPERAERSFERFAPLLFSRPKGTVVVDDGPCAKVTYGTPKPGRSVLYLHGGAFVAGSRRSFRAMAGRVAKRTGATVFIADYPLLQEAPFPAAPTAVLAAWDHLIATGWQPHQIVIAGDSAGGNLVFGLLSQVLARGQRPAGVVAFSPWTDLTLSGETIRTHAKIDAILPVSRMQEAVDLYLQGAPATDPLASPLFADYPNPPPVLIQVGAEEVLLSDSVRMADKLGAELEIWGGCPHVWQIFDGRLPEANEAMRKVARFVQTSFESARR